MTEPLYPSKRNFTKNKHAIELNIPKWKWLSKREIVVTHDFGPTAFKFRHVQPLNPTTKLRGSWLRPHDKPVPFTATVTQSVTDEWGRFFEITAQFAEPIQK